MKVTRKYGLPYSGYISTVDKHRLPLDAIGPPSHDLVLDPEERCWRRRKGSQLLLASAMDEGMLNGLCRQISGLASSSVLYGPETVMGLWSEAAGTYGALSWRDTRSAQGFWMLGREFGAVHYPANFKMPPLYTSLTVFNRCINNTHRKTVAAGSMNFVEVGDELLLPCYGGTPFRWNKLWNPSTVDAGANWNCRIFPIGHIPPLFEMTVLLPTAPNAAIPDGTWKTDDKFYVSVAFEREDGSVSMPQIPRSPNDTLINGRGLVKLVGQTGATYAYVNWSGIPIGPAGTVARRLYRTPKALTVAELKLKDLRLITRIPNNVETTYRDYVGNDASLDVDPLLRFDHMWCPPSRFIWQGDHRVWVGYSKTNPASIVIAPVQNNDDETIGATVYTVQYTTGIAITLRKDALTTVISATVAKTIEQLVDDINATTDNGSNGGKWAAQLVPGADATLTCDQILNTSANDFGDAVVGRMRCYSNAYPGILYASPSYLAKFPEQRRRIYFTGGGPGHPQNAANSWYVGNFRTAPGAWGELMGGAPLLDGQIVCFSKAIAIVRNIKGGKSGSDEDYRIEGLNENRGCISPMSITQGDGWVGYLTRDGYVVTDGMEEAIISGALYSPTTQKGDLALEIQRDATNVGGSSDLTFLSARVIGSRIFLCYRRTSVYYADTISIYDFSQGVAGKGLAEVLQPDGSPWPWSTPLTFDADMVGAALEIGPIQRGRNIYVNRRGYQAGGGVKDDGEITLIESGYYDKDRVLSNISAQSTLGLSTLTAIAPDSFAEAAVGATVSHAGFPAGVKIVSKTSNNATVVLTLPATSTTIATTTVTGVQVMPEGWGPYDLAETTKRKSLERVTVYHRKTASGMSVKFSTDQLGANAATIVLPAIDPLWGFGRTHSEAPLAIRCPTDGVWPAFQDDGQFDTEALFYGAEVEMEILDSQT